MSLRSLVENAVYSVVNGAEISGVTVYKGFSDDVKTSPAVICRAVSAMEDPPFSGNYRVIVEVSVRVVGGTNFDAVCEDVRQVLWTADLSTDLMGTTGLIVYGASASHEMEWGVDEDAWLETHQIEIMCSGV